MRASTRARSAEGRPFKALSTWAVLAAAAALVAVSGPASASPRATCVAGRVCLYASFDFNRGEEDRWHDFIGDDSDLSDNIWLDGDFAGTGRSMDDEASSVRNRAGCTVTLWQYPGYTGAHSTFADGANDGFLANNSVGNNRASSLDIWCA
ncbi:peptidase inhibitor family I36 protein [Nonomuraea pusilla]|uniref:peptidase inhibitor family I36 protein n=1 Tax=Nonomuraea pusilla TaxID=46177 RepID=UPI0033169B32